MSLLSTRTVYGTVTGVAGGGGKYTVFKGIPYARPPVGALRFAPPQKPESWEGERLCGSFSPAPMQLRRNGGDYEMSEDCLYLNIWTPAEAAGEGLPVLFWIFGGGFSFGYGHEPTYDGAAICAEGCILVTINYRVNVFGFFNTPELEERHGGARCCGTLDQIAALDWVRENISAFGGDPDNILVFGQSAGGISTRMLLTSPLTKGKIARAVVHSGGGLNEADLIRPKEEFTRMCVDTLRYVGWTFEDVMKADAQEVLDRMKSGVREMMADNDLAYFQPFVDGYALTDVPGVHIWNGAYPDIPIMCGTVAGDAWMFTRKVLPELRGNRSWLRAFSFSPGVAWGRHNAALGRAPIYTWYMDRPQPPREFKYMTHGKPPFGAETPHSSELPYLFGTLGVVDDRYTDDDYALADTIRAYWINFAKTGDPNGALLPEWPRFTKETPLSMRFGAAEPRAENLITDGEEERVIAFCEAHPGMLTDLNGF